MKRLALWLARHCLMLTGPFYRYGMGVPEDVPPPLELGDAWEPET